MGFDADDRGAAAAVQAPPLKAAPELLDGVHRLLHHVLGEDPVVHEAVHGADAAEGQRSGHLENAQSFSAEPEAPQENVKEATAHGQRQEGAVLNQHVLVTVDAFQALDPLGLGLKYQGGHREEANVNIDNVGHRLEKRENVDEPKADEQQRRKAREESTEPQERGALLDDALHLALVVRVHRATRGRVSLRRRSPLQVTGVAERRQVLGALAVAAGAVLASSLGPG
eukprot:CAMPEP_0168387174 /NCGR_PEP_ID=MMETSP0228-20121227/15808_1 /TAXON_ID=133427 /ORGANISM="Protoceratium reticulatum, Strain CCCM 535 (=CCMP 1889)" /LENGTH=226 /DNA_ID=CAMNT_0008400399 /DNA_START=78 /DNA_END=756 /DNA_ORIENTATION=-